MSRPTPEQFASRKAMFENAINACAGVSTTQIQEYIARVMEGATDLAGEIVRRASAQAVYDVTTNLPTGIINRIGDNRARQVVRESLISAVGKLIGWDVVDALELCAGILEDVNAHEEARRVREMAKASTIPNDRSYGNEGDPCPACGSGGIARTACLHDLRIGDKVRFHPIIGGKHDGNTYVVRNVSSAGVWLEGKPGMVAWGAVTPVERLEAGGAR